MLVPTLGEGLTGGMGEGRKVEEGRGPRCWDSELSSDYDLLSFPYNTLQLA